MGTASSISVDETSLLLNQSGVDLLLTRLPYPAGLSGRQVTFVQRLCSGHQESSLGWGLGQTAGSQASRTPALPVKLYQTLLFALPGTPVFGAGDELGLKAGVRVAFIK